MKNNRLKDMVKVANRLTVCCLTLWCFMGTAFAQHDKPVVIKKNQDPETSEHYLAHVYNETTHEWELQDRDHFTPECIWYTGPDYNLTGYHHNYYFNDGVNNRFLSAPLEEGGEIGLSQSTPTPDWLQNTDQIYYFYDWDQEGYLNGYAEAGGVARGHQYNGVSTSEACEACGGNMENVGTDENPIWECWEVHWIEYENGAWRLSANSYYHTANYGRFRTVTITEVITPTNNSGLGTLSNYVMNYNGQQALSLAPTLPYTYTVNTNYFFQDADHYIETNGSTNEVSGYQWSISGDAKAYLSFAQGTDVNTSTSATPTLFYRVENISGDKTATLTLVVTYGDGATQTRTATVTAKTACQHPAQAAAPVVSYDNVKVSWYDIADSYIVRWKKQSESTWQHSSSLSNVGSYTITTGLEPNTTYQYKVEATCGSSSATGNPTVYTFTTKEEPHALVYGAIYGGGRMANVRGNAEIIVVNCDSIGAIFGGNDIAGEVEGTNGTSITLGTSQTTSNMKISSVYGGGNGYYAYDGTSFQEATSTYFEQSVAPEASVKAMTRQHQVGEAVFTNSGENDITLSFPSVLKTSITVANDFVTVDSIFGGAKNAFLTLNNPEENGSSITINGGTVWAVFGGNNWGGTQQSAKHHIVVTNTKTGTDNAGLGRDFGIGYLFGGGNKVVGSATDILISGGMLDTVFGGGNQASVASALLVVDCEGDKIITNALSGSSLNTEYAWNGTGIYNIRTLFGGNNRAPMAVVPTVTLTSGGIGTAYGGGNAGKMEAGVEGGTFVFDGVNISAFKYGTYMEVSSNDVYIDNLYGGCQMSDVDYSTWVELQGGNVGTVYGGCNISGDVGSLRTNNGASSPSEGYQSVRGATYVHATGGTVHRNLFAGSNGYYHCNNGIEYIAGVNYADPEERYVNLRVPTHNETNVFLGTGTNNTFTTVEGDVFAGGNLACVGFTDWTVPPEYNVYNGEKRYPQFVGLAAVHMSDGLVKGNVFGGGSMASVYGSNEVSVSGGEIRGALYGGNDKTGQVAQITNRVMPSLYNYASDGETSLAEVRTYVSVTGSPTIGTVYGGGNGDYDYNQIQYCGYSPDKPIQSNTFVDIAIDGGENGGQINTVYGGGNGVTSQGTITVFYNVKGNDLTYDNVKTIFGGNNKGELTNVVPDIILYKGRVHDVYGGCNSGAMLYDEGFDYHKTVALDADGDGTPEQTFNDVGSYVRLLNTYKNHNVTAVVSGNVYGGCRMNGVEKTSLVLVENRDYSSATIFGGSDISGTVEGTSRVVVAGTVGDVYGGGNGNYDYVNEGNVHEVYVAGSDHTDPDNLIATNTFEIKAPYSTNSRVDMLSGTCIANHNLYAGGYAGLCGTTQMNVVGGTVNDNVFGGGNMAGTTTSFTYSYAEPGNPNNILSNTIAEDGSSTVNVTGGSVLAGVYGGCNASGTIAGNVDVNIQSNLGTDAAAMTAGIYGGGFGANTGTAGNVTVTIDKQGNVAPVIYADVYGGSALGQVNDDLDDLTKIDFKNGNLHGNIFGGGKGQVADPDATPAIPGISAIVNGDIEVAISNGTLYNSIYGGCNFNGDVKGDIAVNVTGGNIGTNTATADVFGGGYGHNTTTKGNVTVTVTKATGDGAPAAPTIYGDVYGGSGFGDVNTASEDITETDLADITTVHILDGSIKKTTGGNGGNVYGGSLGDNNNPAHVNGKVYVNIGSGVVNDDGVATSVTGNAIIEGDVYGCNNENGTPLDDVFVNIYKTNHSGYNVYPTTVPTTVTGLNALGKTDDYFALNAVYGGGNKAAYTPPVVNNVPKTATVHVYSCENTIKNVYGGGNAADVGVEDDNATTANEAVPANTMVRIDGGRIYRVFGGGNGDGSDDPTAPNYNPGANIFGTATSYVYAGLINEVYGGANKKGSIDVIDLHLPGNDLTGCTDEVFGSVFGCANEAPLNHSITTTVKCGVGTIGELYGGSNLARIGKENTYEAVVTLNLYGGAYDKVFGGSKGVAPATGVEGIAAPIWGNVVLNLYGGTIGEAFGGCDQNGNVYGEIQVNVFDIEDNDCPLVVTDVYGASNQTAYTPSYPVGEGETRQSPVVNVIHVAEKTPPVTNVNVPGILGDVYGGGKEGEVTSNPVVNVGYDATVMGTLESGLLKTIAPSGYTEPTGGFRAYVKENVLGGGNNAAVNGTATVNLRKANSRVNNLFGAGNNAGTTNSIVNVYDGIVATAVYGGCNDRGSVTGDINVNIYGGTLGTSSSDIQIFGGGYGGPDGGSNPGTTTGGNVTVTIGGDDYAPTIYGTVYGGSALGSVNSDTEDLTKVWLKTGTVNGRVYGGGLGRVASTNPVVTAVEAHVKGNIEVVGNGTNVTTCIYGANNQNGNPEGTVTVTVNAGVIGNVVGGGNVAAYSAPGGNLNYPFVTITGTAEVQNKVVGGGNAADIVGNPRVVISGGSVGTNASGTGIGVYGGCNDSGIVDGTTSVTVSGGTIGSETNFNLTTPVLANVFGGGYGEETKVKGNVTVTVNKTGTTAPTFYGDVYGGSALGEVNTNDQNATTTTTTTTVNILDGLFKSHRNQQQSATGQNYYTYTGGNIFGGGLGRKASTSPSAPAVLAKVYGPITVNIGAVEEAATPTYNGTYTGNATIEGNVYGCNNTEGSPQQNVTVNVYGTAHDDNNAATYGTPDNPAIAGNPATYALNNVFGGGNEADFTVTGKLARVNVYGCDNTIERVFGGGNAADVPGTYVYVDGGRFDWIFGGGNGEAGSAYAANITGGGVYISTGGGLINTLVNGSNMNGLVTGDIIETNHEGCDLSQINYHFLGSNSDDIHGDITVTIPCGTNMKYMNLYGGSNFAHIYGNINVTVEGGEFENFFGGSKGAAEGDPTHPNGFASNIYDYDAEYIASYNAAHPGHEIQPGDGGHVTLLFKGGKIGNIYGGCDQNGNIAGKITITVEEDETLNQNCRLFIGNIYGGGNHTDYVPTNTSITSASPEVNIKNGTIGGNRPAGNTFLQYEKYDGNVYGGGNDGDVTSSPKVVIGDKTNANYESVIMGDVFGGGNAADVTGDTHVILQGKATIGHEETIDNETQLVGGDVFGGGRLGDVTGSTSVVLDPTE